MFQCLLVCLNDVLPLSITSMAFSNASLVHLPLMLTMMHLLTLRCFFLGSGIKEEHFICLVHDVGLSHFASCMAQLTSLGFNQDLLALISSNWMCALYPHKMYEFKFFKFVPRSKKL